MSSCLSKAIDHVKIHPSGGKLRNLHDLKLKVGRYMGISNDGCCIIAWDWDI
jgi:hypothetical protein